MPMIRPSALAVPVSDETLLRWFAERREPGGDSRHGDARAVACGKEFCFTAAEQRLWYEEYRFYVDSLPKVCTACRRENRRLKTLRQEYDREVAKALASEEFDLKVHVASVIDQLREAGVVLPAMIHANRELLSKQIARRFGQRVV